VNLAAVAWSSRILYRRALARNAMTTTAAAAAKLLAEAGIERVFGLPGGEILVLMDELRRAGVDFVLMRHEANAGIAAAVHGKLRRQPGVMLATLGPGAANLMLPLSKAYLDQEPLLAISAQIPDESSAPSSWAAVSDGGLWTLPVPWTRRARPPHLAKRADAFRTAPTGRHSFVSKRRRPTRGHFYFVKNGDISISR
jgi:thiamine pyrophosphate-dependent acetolactate synthase large subunit-like protein